MATPRILTPRKFYRPFEYPHFFEYFQKQNQAHWMPTEVPMEADIADYRFRLSEQEKNLIIQILRFFTQGDIEVNNNYNTRLIPAIPNTPGAVVELPGGQGERPDAPRDRVDPAAAAPWGPRPRRRPMPRYPPTSRRPGRPNRSRCRCTRCQDARRPPPPCPMRSRW